MTLAREDQALVEQAKAILSLNWTGEYTQPGPRLYPHQWSWDSAFVALAYAHYDQVRAEKELRHLFEAQWSNGLLPQIVFNPRFRDYFPGPSFWNASESPNAPKRSRPGTSTSTARGTRTTRDWSTSAIPGNRGWTTPRCGPPSCCDCTFGRSRSPSTSGPIPTSSAQRIARLTPLTIGLPTW